MEWLPSTGSGEREAQKQANGKGNGAVKKSWQQQLSMRARSILPKFGLSIHNLLCSLRGSIKLSTRFAMQCK